MKYMHEKMVVCYSSVWGGILKVLFKINKESHLLRCEICLKWQHSICYNFIIKDQACNEFLKSFKHHCYSCSKKVIFILKQPKTDVKIIRLSLKSSNVECSDNSLTNCELSAVQVC